MNRSTVREMLKTMPITEIPLRVTYYARVSTDKDVQLNSLGNQESYYENYIHGNPKWIFVPGYIDEGLTGVTVKKRERFNDMIADGLNGMFDLIVTKEISRFARNTLDSIMFTRELMSKDVWVFFQNDNINTIDEDGELRLTIMAALAQDESRRLSARVKFGHAQSIKNNVVHGNGLMYGYLKDNRRLIIDESQAGMVRLLFEMYATDEYSLKQLEQVLYEMGYKNRNGNRISHVTLSNILSNPKYKGYYCGGKVKIVDMFTKKQEFLPKEEWRMFKDETGEIVPAIVSEELWDTANEILVRRSNDVKGRKNTYTHGNLLTKKLYCTHCNATFYKKQTLRGSDKSDSFWCCKEKIANGTDSCPTYPVYESEVKKILLDILSGDTTTIDERISNYEKIFLSVASTTDYSRDISAIQSEIGQIEKKVSKALDLNIAGSISDSAFSRLSQECDAKLLEAYERLDHIKNKERVSKNAHGEILALKTALKQASKDAADGIITNQFINQYISGIYATMVDGVMHLEIRFKGIDKGPTAIYNSRSGSMVNTMLPGQPFHFIRSLRSASNHKLKREYSVTVSVA